MMFGRNPGSDETWKRIPKGSVGVELGVWKGDSSEKFLRRAGHLHLVDPWAVTAYENSDEFGDYVGYLKRYSSIVGSTNPNDFQRYYDTIYKNVLKRFANKSVTIHRMPVIEFFKVFNQQVDWVYVDALHSFEGCLNDLRKSLTIIRPGGSIFGDDYTPTKPDKRVRGKPGVTAAVDTFVKETNLPFNNFYLDQFEIKVDASIK